MGNFGLWRWLGEQLQRMRTGEDAATQLELTIEPIPKSLANQNLRKQIGEHQWRKISKRERAKYDHKCAICGVAPGKGRLHCHEVWRYDDTTRVQKLSGFEALCDPCHRENHGVWIKHLATWPLKKVNLATRLESYRRQREWLTTKYQEEMRLPENERDLKSLEDLAKQANAVMPCEQFLRVNGCDIKTAERYIKQVARKYRRRSQRTWRVDYGEYAGLVS